MHSSSHLLNYPVLEFLVGSFCSFNLFGKKFFLFFWNLVNIFLEVMYAHSFKSYIVPKAWFEKQHSPPSPSPHSLFSISQGNSLNWLAGRWSFMPPGYMLLSPRLNFSLSAVSIGFPFWRLKIELFFMSSPIFLTIYMHTSYPLSWKT